MKYSDLTSSQKKQYDSLAKSLGKNKKKKEEEEKEKQEKKSSFTDELFKKNYERMEKSINTAREHGKMKSATQETLANISLIADRDKEKAQELYNRYDTLSRKADSKYYDPYKSSTNKSVERMRDMGYDVDKVDDDWFKKYSGLKNYYETSDYTNTPKAPTKKSTDESKAAYEYYQMLQAEDTTKKAEQEQEDLRKYLTAWEIMQEGR